MRENKGITLIALIVTIIVLLILAAVSIATLMGKNGVITNAQKTSTENAYYGAIEEVKLAYMAVRTEIMSQVVTDGTYDAISNTAELAKIVKNDLSGSEWSVVGTTKGKITITYTDTKIDKETIGNVNIQNTSVSAVRDEDNNVTTSFTVTTNLRENVKTPTKEGSIVCEIVLEPQTAHLNIDI